MHALQLHWYEVLAAVILLVVWTALQLVLVKPPVKPKQEDKSEQENPEPIDMDAYVKCRGREIAETLRWKRFDF